MTPRSGVLTLGSRYRPAWLKLVRIPLKLAERRALAALQGGAIRGPADVATLLRAAAEVEEQEVFWTILLDSQSQVLGTVEVTRGILNATMVHPREVFRIAIGWGAAGIIVAHNHPSGDVTPSAEDRSTTRGLVAAGALLDIPLYDHVIVAEERHFSFAEAGLL